VHVLVGILAVGSSAGSSLWLRLAMRNPMNLPFALRSAKFLDERLTRPGLVVLLITGLWMATSRWSLALLWVRAALILLAIVLVLLYGVVGPILTRLIRVAETEGQASAKWRRPELVFELVGGGSGLLIIVIVWLMVTKPS
jgi:uncharacterized membrane protein